MGVSVADYLKDMIKKAKEEKEKAPEKKNETVLEKKEQKTGFEKKLKEKPVQKTKPADEFLEKKQEFPEKELEAKPIVEKEEQIEIPAEAKKALHELKEKTIEDPAKEETPKQSEAEKELKSGEKKEIESYGETKIYKIPGKPLLYYYIPVPKPNQSEKSIIYTLKEAATRLISIAPYKIRDPEQRRNVYRQKILEILEESPELKIPKRKFEFYADSVVREMVGYGLIDLLIRDDQLEEIMVIGKGKPVYVFHRKHEMMKTNIEFFSDDEINDVINRIAREVGRRVDISAPLLDAKLPDGSRVNATIAPASVSGSSLTIRKFRKDPYSIIDLINSNTLTIELAAFLWLCVEGLRTRPANILIAGGTGSGKTTTLNVLASFVPKSERIVTIEDTAELNLPLEHWIRLEARPPGLEEKGEIKMDILTKNSLRMRPDRIIVGEIRHDEAFTLFTAMNTGHDGSLGTVHSNSGEETIIRVSNPPMNVPVTMLSGLDFVLVQHRLHDKKKGTIRRITELSEVTGALQKKPETQTLFERTASKDSIEKTNIPSNYLKKLQDLSGLTNQQILEELKKRENFLKKLIQEKKREMSIVSEEMQKYLDNSGD